MHCPSRERLRAATEPFMFTPQTAVVRPRIVSPVSGEILPLDDAVAGELARGARIIQISGGPGSGKTTALAHLVATLPPARWLCSSRGVENSRRIVSSVRTSAPAP